ncbi:MAG: VOC family protein [Candidatus Dormibacteria bacterium]
MGRVTHFEMPVDDPDRAERFYADVFGWTVQRFEGAPSYYGMITTGDDGKPGINGGFFARSEGNATSVTLEVDDIEKTAAVVVAKGGKVLQGKTPIPGMGYFANCEDTEGNRFGLFTNDASASI